jgi:hypothetical protein
MLFEQQVYGFFAEGLCRAAEIEGQHSKLFPALRRQIDRQNALALSGPGPRLGGNRRRDGDVGRSLGLRIVDDSRRSGWLLEDVSDLLSGVLNARSWFR